MRRKAGDSVSLFNGQDGEWSAEISLAGKARVELRITEMLQLQEKEPDIWLIFAPIKMGRIDFLVEKATELGAAKLLPVFTSRTIVSRVNIDRLKAHAIEAAEQSERLSVPEITEPMKLEKLLAGWDKNRKIILCDESGTAKKFSNAVSEHDKSAILIGPEGGFTPEEFKMLYNCPFVIPTSLGPRILRADTAALAALALWQELRVL